MKNMSHPTRKSLLCATALSALLVAGAPLSAQTIDLPAGSNTEPDTAPSNVNNSGFVISVDGQPVNRDPAVEDRIRRTDIALAEADIQISFDGLDPTPRLNVEVAGTQVAAPGDVLTLRSETNYPAYITRAELRILDAGAIGGARLLSTVPIAPNGSAQVTVPEGADVVVVHRVYDDRGRFDETAPLSLTDVDARGLTVHEDGVSSLAVSNINVTGGAVTVAVQNAAPGASLSALGEQVAADSNGDIVIQRILPPGDYDVRAVLAEGHDQTSITRALDVPRADWFYIILGDVTISGIGSEDGTQDTGRAAFYVEREAANGLRITSSLDTGYTDLDGIFSRLDERDPLSLSERLQTYDGFATFGDDSTIRDLAPSSGRFYFRADYENSFALWGDFQATLDGNTYIRNERVLYGAQGVYESPEVTDRGEARYSAELYAAQPDQLAGRDIFRGTTGSVFFLRRQDVTPGTESLSVELRDPDTGRLLERQVLVEGTDYEINYIQGVIVLTEPLEGQVSDGLIQDNVGGDVEVNLIAQYEFTPTGTEVEGLSFGGRGEAWITDDLRLGVNGTVDETGLETQIGIGVDLRYELGDNSFVQLDYAETEGPGYATTFSLDGGLTLDREDTATGDGRAVRAEAQLDFGDLGLATDGTVGGYYEQRTEGFSTLDYQVTATTGGETLYGGFVTGQPTERLAYRVSADVYENETGGDQTEFGAEIDYDITDRLAVTFAAEWLDRDGDTRTDLGAELSYSLTEDTEAYVFGYNTIDRSGLDRNERYGIGVTHEIDNGWSVAGELSDGTDGFGGTILASHADEDGNSTYLGYEFDQGREIGSSLSSRGSGGRVVSGGRRVLDEDLVMFGENVFDFFGDERSLTSTYGVEYQANDLLTYDAALTFGQVSTDAGEEFDRTGISLGLRYADDQTTATARGELRIDQASPGSSRSDAEVLAFVADIAHRISEEERVLLSFTATESSSDESAVLNGTYVDANLGYAFRPINDERLNVLVSVRHLYDGIGQTIDGVAGAGDVQRSTVFSFQGNYDLNEQWTIGGAFAGRISETGPDEDNLTSNDAYLLAVNARYHFVREWDALLEIRQFEAVDGGFSETGVLGAIYRQFGDNLQAGVGYNFGSFSDDLTDLTRDDGGLFLNLTAAF